MCVRDNERWIVGTEREKKIDRPSGMGREGERGREGESGRELGKGGKGREG